METGVTVRSEHPGDVAAVDALVGEAFEGRANEVALVRALRVADTPALSRVAVEDGTVVGHAMLSRLRLVGSEQVPVLGLAPMAVAAHRQGRGIGRLLTEDALVVAEASGAAMVIVLGDPAFYGRFGFALARTHHIEPPPDVAPGAFLMARLSSYDGTAGHIAYPPIFTETGTL
jgi:putative acetyltransferase